MCGSPRPSGSSCADLRQSLGSTSHQLPARGTCRDSRDACRVPLSADRQHPVGYYFSDRSLRFGTGERQFAIGIFDILLADGDGFVLDVEVAPEMRRDLALP